MDICEIQETIKKHITIVRKTIVRPFNFDIIVKVPKQENKNGGLKNEREN